MFICVLQNADIYRYLADAHKKIGLSPAPSMKVCGTFHFTSSPKEKNAHENTQCTGAVCWALQQSSFATAEQKLVHC